MKIFKKLICFLLVFSFASLLLVSCKKDAEIYPEETYLKFDPYDNLFKDPVDMGDPIEVSGKTFVFKEIDIRDKNAEKQVYAEAALKKLYNVSAVNTPMKVKFINENTVEFIDYLELVFCVPETECARDGNVLTFERTNSDGYKYDVRIELHEDKIYVIHEGHTYNTPGTFSIITFELQK